MMTCYKESKSLKTLKESDKFDISEIDYIKIINDDNQEKLIIDEENDAVSKSPSHDSSMTSLQSEIIKIIL